MFGAIGPAGPRRAREAPAVLLQQGRCHRHHPCHGLFEVRPETPRSRPPSLNPDRARRAQIRAPAPATIATNGGATAATTTRPAAGHPADASRTSVAWEHLPEPCRPAQGRHREGKSRGPPPPTPPGPEPGDGGGEGRWEGSGGEALTVRPSRLHGGRPGREREGSVHDRT